MGAPLVSVAISTWNRSHLVGRAVRSALGQSVGNFEIIVVDDGSTDDTPAVLAGLDDGRLRRVRHERNSGVGRTRNTAIGLARGEWIAFLDDDNEWAPTYLERQLAFAASRPSAGVVYCRARVRDDHWGTDLIQPLLLRHGKVFAHLVTGWIPFISGALIRRDEAVAIGGLDERLHAAEDTDLWMRLARRTDFAGNGDILLVRHIRHGPQLSGNPENVVRDTATLDAKWRQTVVKDCGRLAHRRWLAGRLVYAERCRTARAIEAGASSSFEALRVAGRLVRLLPWSAPSLIEGLARSILGVRLLRRAQSYGYRLRTGRGPGFSGSHSAAGAEADRRPH